MRLRPLVLAAGLAAAPLAAAAEEPTGCAAFRWPLESERAALSAPEKPSVVNGGALRYDAALSLKLAPFAEAALPKPPERAPKATPSFAGHFTLAAPTKPGIYKITLDSDGWIDVVDEDGYLHPKAFSGALGCQGARKSLKFELLPERAVDIEISNVKDTAIGVMVTPAE